MEKFEKPTVEICYFDSKDIITASTEHDNGFVDSDILPYKIKEKIEELF